MNFINGLTVLLVFQLTGELIVRTAGFSVPGPVLGMFLLLIYLLVRKKVSEPLEQTSSGLLAHLSLLFVPAGVGVMTHFSRIGDEWQAIVSALVFSTLIAIAVTALVMKWLLKIQDKLTRNGHDDAI